MFTFKDTVTILPTILLPRLLKDMRKTKVFVKETKLLFGTSEEMNENLPLLQNLTAPYKMGNGGK